MSIRSESPPQTPLWERILSWAAVLILAAFLVYIIYQGNLVHRSGALTSPTLESTPPPATQTPPPAETPAVEPSPEPTPEPTLPPFEPGHVESTAPDKWLAATGVQVEGKTVESYTAARPMDFGYGEDYPGLPGILTFQGNNFRETASYGTAKLTERAFGNFWTVDTASLQAPDGAVWTGVGWTGQPLIVQWPKETRAVMNLYDWAKEQDELVEVICAAMDGKIYFMELTTGKRTRPDLTLGYTFKGAGALDPRGYPLLYLGSGYDSAKGASRAFIVSLIDFKVLYEYGNQDSFSWRGGLSYFDSSALVDVETDTLIHPGENGIVYIIHLNSSFDPAAGTVSINPDPPVKWRYKGKRSGSGSYWLGMEDSAVVWRNRLIIADNGGHLFSLNLDTLTVDWVQDVLDDTNCSPVLELEDGHPYVYISTSFHGGWRAPVGATAPIPIWKIDAMTGEIVWEKEYTCHTEAGVSGGVQGSPAIGKGSLSKLIYVPVARTSATGAGVLAALDKETGEIVWEYKTTTYSWSTPAVIYDQDGRGYVIYATSGGGLYLLDGLTGEVLSTSYLGGLIEASPSVYENTLVIGTRHQKIYGITLK